jgi:hypothetical protein
MLATPTLKKNRKHKNIVYDVTVSLKGDNRLRFQANTPRDIAEALNDIWSAPFPIVTPVIVRNIIYYPNRVSPKWDFLTILRVDKRVTPPDR